MNEIIVPDIEMVSEIIERIDLSEIPEYKKGQDVSNYVNNILQVLHEELKFEMKIKHPVLQQNFFDSFFRARELETFDNIGLIREHSYPPIDKVNMGRCNFPGNPVFYCSTSPMVALLEVSRSNNYERKKYCISKWELDKVENNMFYESYLHLELPESNVYKAISDEVEKSIGKPFRESLKKDLNKKQEEGLIEYLRFINSCFINDTSYSISASIAYKSLFANDNYRTDVLLYPSIQSQFQGVNLAFNPNFVENNLKMTRLYIVELKSYSKISSEINIEFHKYADVEKNIVVWKNIYPDDNHYSQIINEDFGAPIKSSFTPK